MISNVNMSNPTWTGATNNAKQQRQKSSNDLFSALESGDLSAAQKAYVNLTRSGLNGGSTPSLNPNTPIGKIGQALQNADLGTAKKIAQDLKSLHQNASAVSKSIQSAFNGVAAASSGASKALGALNNLQDALQVLDASQNPKGNLGLPGSINTLA